MVVLAFRIEQITSCSSYGQPYPVQPSTQVRVLQHDELFELPAEALQSPQQASNHAALLNG